MIRNSRSDADQIRSFVARLRAVDEEIIAKNSDKSAIYKEAREARVDVKALKAMVRRERDPETFDAATEAVDTYRAAIVGVPKQGAHLFQTDSPRDLTVTEVNDLLRSGELPSQDFAYADASIYFAIDDEAKLVKVGISRNVEFRIRDIERQSGRALRVIGTLPGNRAAELAAHGALRFAHHRGEWFRATSEALDKIEDLLHARAPVRTRGTQSDVPRSAAPILAEGVAEGTGERPTPSAAAVAPPSDPPVALPNATEAAAEPVIPATKLPPPSIQAIANRNRPSTDKNFDYAQPEAVDLPPFLDRRKRA